MGKIINILRKNKKFIIGIIIGIILSGTTVYASQYILASSEVSYDKTSSGLTSDNVQDALDELNTKANNMWCKSGYEKTDITGGYQCTLPPVNFNDATPWEDIISGLRNGTLIINVGDTKTVDMGRFGTHTLRVANTTTPAECGATGFSQTACGLVLEFADFITEYYMNSTDTNVGGWPASSMRTYVNSDIYNALPEGLKNAIIDTTVVSGYGCLSGWSYSTLTCSNPDNNGNNFTSTDKLYLLSPMEIWGNNSYSVYDSARNLSRQMDYYSNLGVNDSSYSGAIKQGSSYYGLNYVWLRSADSRNNRAFYYVRDDGTWSSYTATQDIIGVSPAFRLR